MRRCLPFALALVVMMGCSPETGLFQKANPRFEFKGPGNFSVTDSTDSDFEIEEGTYEPKTGNFKVKNMKLKKNVSDPRKADALQNASLVGQQEAFNHGIDSVGNLIGKLADVAAQVIPMFRSSPITPTTQPATTQPDKLDAILLRLQALEKLLPVPPSP